jgi:hypothetical protein
MSISVFPPAALGQICQPAASTSQSDRNMSPFRRIPREALTSMIEREVLFSQPDEFFHPFFGRTPTLEEKLLFIERAILGMTSLNIFENDVYRVEIAYHSNIIQLTITRHDRKPCHDWRHFQQIKNELVGPEHEAVEVFPAESRLVDTANEYHLWVQPQPGVRLPFGFPSRFVLARPASAPLFATTPASTGSATGADRLAHAGY